MDTRLTDGRVISVWYRGQEICIWDTKKGELLRTVDIPEGEIVDLRISGDGSQLFCLYYSSIRAWSIWTGDCVGEMGYSSNTDILTIDGLKVWVGSEGWNFGILGSSPVKLPGMSQNWPHLYFVDVRQWKSFIPGIQDTATKKVVFQLPGRLARCSDAQWNGQYLVAGYDSGEMLILECNYMPH